MRNPKRNTDLDWIWAVVLYAIMLAVMAYGAG